MRVLVTGINGQLGYDVVKELQNRNHTPIGVDREDMDLTSPEQIKECIQNVKPEVIIHCAAYTAVDAAEDNEELCRRVNALAVKDIAECAKELDIPMVYISTDYVFNGKKGIETEDKISNKDNYKEYLENDNTNPVNIYGKTKLEGELYVRELLEKYYIVRISWVFGENGNNFIDTMLRLSKDRSELNVIDDQIGSPTYTKDLAPLLVDMIETDKYGIYHATNDGFCSWYEFAREIFNIANIDITVNSILTSQYPTRAARPINSKMSKQKLIDNGFSTLRSWKDALKDYIRNA
ncbi:MAG TPA: dTDP-4-dehydrorhamnose reductase [Clostridium perfringens]|nr:dTDP-4-dehydrorhamnose reductase [Clostridium perfringens]